MALRGVFFHIVVIVWPLIYTFNIYQNHMRDLESQREGKFIPSGVEGTARSFFSREFDRV